VAAQARAAGAQIIVDCRGASAAALLTALEQFQTPTPDAKDGHVSEAATPPKQDETAADEIIVTPPPAPAKAPHSAGRGLSVLALLIALGGAGAGGWSLWQQQQLGQPLSQQA